MTKYLNNLWHSQLQLYFVFNANWQVLASESVFQPANANVGKHGRAQQTDVCMARVWTSQTSTKG